MFDNLSFSSLTNTISNAANRLWDSTKSFLTIEPEPLWQKAMREPGYQSYLRFKSDLEHRSEEALENIVSPYAVITNQELPPQTHDAISQLLQSNSETALMYFYDDIINHLVELSASQMNNGLLRTNTTIDTFNQMLEFYQPYVPEDIYHDVLKQTQLIDITNIQSSLVNVTKKINQAFKHLQLDLNSNAEAEQHFSQNPEPYHSVNYKHLILMGAVSLLANKPSFGLGLATTALLAESVDAALPTVVNPIPTQYVDPGQTFIYDIDLNQVFNDADGDIMSFGGATQADGSPLPSWVKAEPIKLWGREYYEDVQNLELVGNIAYVANGQNGLLILNVSDLNSKKFLSSVDTPGLARDVTVQNGVAYVADDTTGLQLIDVSNIKTPTLISSIATPGAAYGVSVQSGIAYVAYYGSGLQLINVSDVNNPTLLGRYNTPGNAYDVVVQNDIAYVSDRYSGLQIINVSNANNPTLLSNYNRAGAAYRFTVQNGVAYIAYYGSGLEILNVSNASNPTVLGRYTGSGPNAWAVAVQNGVAYITDIVYGDFQVLDVTNVRNPIALGRYYTPAGVTAVAVQNGIAYVAAGSAAGNHGLLFINVSNASSPTLIVGSYDFAGGYARTVLVQNGVAYIANQLIDVSNPSKPVLLGSYGTPGNSYGVAVQNGVAYIATSISGGLVLMNVSNARSPVPLGSYNTPGDARGVFVQNGVAYVADYDFGLQLINVSNTQTLRLLGNYDTPGQALNIAVQNSIAYVADGGSGLQLINVSNPQTPSLLGTYDTPGYTHGVVVQNGVAYVADANSLQLINVSNPVAPSLLGYYALPGGESVAVQNDVAYVATYSFGIQFINVTNPSMPTFLGSYDTFGIALDVTVLNGVAYVADGPSCLQIIGLGHTRLFGVAPTNANGSYYFAVSATNANGEWISTNMELIVGTVSPATSASSLVSTSSGAASATQTSLPTLSGSPMTTPSVSMSDTGTSSTLSTPLTMPSNSITVSPSQPSSPTAASTSTTASNPVPTTSTQPNPSTGNSGDVSSASRLTGSLLLTSALLLSTTGLGFLAKNRKTERPQEEAVEVVENTIVLRH